MFPFRIVFDGNFWTMVAAVATAAGALIASFALVASGVAIKAARDVDANNAERARDREARDAIPLAVAIQHELHNALGYLDSVTSLQRIFPNSPADVVQRLILSRAQMMPATLEKHIAQLGCFDKDTGRKVAGALTMSRIAYNFLNFDESNMDVANRAAGFILGVLEEHATKTRPALHDAVEALAAYSNVAPTARNA